MVDLEALLGIDRNDPAQRLATELVEQDQDLIRNLVRERHQKGLRQEDVAERLGVAQSTVAAFERTGNDPRLSTIRRYAQAIGALVTHTVRSFETERVAVEAADQLHRATRIHDVAWESYVIRFLQADPPRQSHRRDQTPSWGAGV
jgi:transcriptional regulator with XRE-family HTH domain